MKLIIEIDKDRYNKIMNNAKHVCLTGLDSVIAGGIPLDDVKTEIFRQSKQNNENFCCDWNEGFNYGMFHTLTIIKECFKHISGKAESEENSNE